MTIKKNKVYRYETNSHVSTDEKQNIPEKLEMSYRENFLNFVEYTREYFDEDE